MACRTDTETPMLGHSLSQKTSEKLQQYIAAISVSLGTLCAGTALAWTSPALAQLASNTNSTMDDDGFRLTPTECAAVGSVLTLGALIAAVPIGYLADKFGRKRIILAVSLVFFINWIIVISARNAAALLAARFFAGIATGAICVTAPMYIGEIAETSIRGQLGSFIQMFLSLGILITCIIGSLTTWWVLSLLLMFTPLAFGVSFVFMPESPVYLVETNQKQKAEETLKRFRGNQYDVQSELRAMEQEVEEARNHTVKITQIFTEKPNRRAFIAVVGVLSIQQLCGLNAVVFYTVMIFEEAGSSLSPNLVGIIVGLVQVIGSYISILIIEKANRKLYLMLSAAGMMTFLAGLGMFFHLKKFDFDSINNIGFIPIFCVIGFMAFFCIGYGPIPWMLMGELFSPEIRGIGNGFGVLANWLCAFLVTSSFLLIKDSVGAHVAFYICSLICGISIVFVHFLVPETRGKSLAEIHEALHR